MAFLSMVTSVPVCNLWVFVLPSIRRSSGSPVGPLIKTLSFTDKACVGAVFDIPTLEDVTKLVVSFVY